MMKSGERNIVLQAFDTGLDFYSFAKVLLAIAFLAVAMVGCGTKKLTVSNSNSSNGGNLNGGAALGNNTVIADTQSARAVRTIDGQGNQVVRVSFRPRVPNLKFTRVRTEGGDTALSDSEGTPCATADANKQVLTIRLPNSDITSLQLEGKDATNPLSIGNITVPIVTENPLTNVLVDNNTGGLSDITNPTPVLTCRNAEGSPISVATSIFDRLAAFTLAVKDADAANRNFKITVFLDFGDGTPVKVSELSAGSSLNAPVVVEHLYLDNSPRMVRVVTVNQFGLRGGSVIPIFAATPGVAKQYIENTTGRFNSHTPTEVLKALKPTSIVVAANGNDMTGGAKVAAYHMPTQTKLFEFLPRMTNATTAYAKGARVALGDVDGDGNLDIVTGFEDGDQVNIHSGVDRRLLGEAKTVFGNAARPTYVASSDIDGDGKSEIVVSTDQDLVRTLKMVSAAAGATPATFQSSLDLNEPFGNNQNNLRPAALGENVIFTKANSNEVRGFKRAVGAATSLIARNPVGNNNDDNATIATLGWGRKLSATGAPVRSTQIVFSNARQNPNNTTGDRTSRFLMFDVENPGATISVTTFEWPDYSGENRLSAMDFNGDGISDYISGSGPYDKNGAATKISQFRIYNGATGTEMTVNNVPVRIDPFPGYEQGIYVSGFVNP